MANVECRQLVHMLCKLLASNLYRYYQNGSTLLLEAMKWSHMCQFWNRQNRNDKISMEKGITNLCWDQPYLRVLDSFKVEYQSKEFIQPQSFILGVLCHASTSGR